MAVRLPRGFSLTEVLLAVATVAVGMLFIGGAFVLGIHYATISTEQTIGAAVVREAVCTVRLRGIFRHDLLAQDRHLPYTQDRSGKVLSVDDRLYPSIGRLARQYRQYYWQALCRADPLDPCSVLLTVFVCRSTLQSDVDLPEPVQVQINATARGLCPEQAGYVYDGGLLVRDADGLICRARRLADQGQELFSITPKGQVQDMSGRYWVIRSPDGKGRDPTLAIYQTRLSLPDSRPSVQVQTSAGGGL